MTLHAVNTTSHESKQPPKLFRFSAIVIRRFLQHSSDSLTRVLQVANLGLLLSPDGSLEPMSATSQYMAMTIVVLFLAFTLCVRAAKVPEQFDK